MFNNKKESGQRFLHGQNEYEESNDEEEESKMEESPVNQYAMSDNLMTGDEVPHIDEQRGGERISKRRTRPADTVQT